MTHEHKISIEDVFFKDFVHFICFDAFKVASSVGEQGKWDALILEGDNCVSGTLDGGGTPDKYPIDISNKEGFKLSLLFDNVSNMSDDSFHWLINSTNYGVNTFNSYNKAY